MTLPNNIHAVQSENAGWKMLSLYLFVFIAQAEKATEFSFLFPENKLCKIKKGKVRSSYTIVYAVIWKIVAIKLSLESKIR